MPLFIDRLPFQEMVVPFDGRSFRSWYPLLPMLMGEPEDQTPPPGALCRLWKYDTGNAFDAYAWLFHLGRAGFISADADRRRPGTVTGVAANGAQMPLPLRKMCLWLVSNIPHLRDSPLRIPLHRGLPFANAPYPVPDVSVRRTVYPLLGIRAFRRTGLKVLLDMEDLTISIWTPGSWLHGVGRALRRIPRNFAMSSLEQMRQDDWV